MQKKMITEKMRKQLNGRLASPWKGRNEAPILKKKDRDTMG